MISDSLFQVGSFQMYLFGICTLVASFLFLMVIRFIEGYMIKKDKLHVLDAWWPLLLSAFIGGYLFAIIFHLPEYLADPARIFFFWQYPLSGVGSFLGPCVYLYYEMRHRKGLRREAFDIMITAMFAMMPLMFLAIQLYGSYRGAPFVFDVQSLPYIGLTVYDLIPRLALHPIGFYGAIISALSFIIMWLMWIRDVRVGFISGFGIIMFGVCITLGELLRFPDDVILLFHRFDLVLASGILIILLGILYLLSGFVHLEKVHHVVHHNYEEDV